LIGVPVYEDPNVADLGANAKVGYIGDMSKYYIREAGGLEVARSDEFGFNTDLVSYKFILRTDSATLDASAIKRLTCPA
jgi:HK97 family phage major capsid protein